MTRPPSNFRPPPLPLLVGGVSIAVFVSLVAVDSIKLFASKEEWRWCGAT